MPQVLPFFPELPQHDYTITLDGAQYNVRLTYRERRCSWYLDLFTADGTPVALGRRLSPGFAPVLGQPVGAPPGLLFVEGAEPYERDGISLVYSTLEELEAL